MKAGHPKTACAALSQGSLNLPNHFTSQGQQNEEVLHETTNQPFPSIELDSDQLTRWAGLISDGIEPFPSGLNPLVRERLAKAINQKRKNRLFRFIAIVIAIDFHEKTNRIAN